MYDRTEHSATWDHLPKFAMQGHGRHRHALHGRANALLAGSGTTSIVLADLCEPGAILAHPKVRALTDFRQASRCSWRRSWPGSAAMTPPASADEDGQRRVQQIRRRGL